MRTTDPPEKIQLPHRHKELDSALECTLLHKAVSCKPAMAHEAL